MDTQQYNREIAELLTPYVKNPAAVALGRLGGLAKSHSKTVAAKANGLRGGRPKGSKTHKSASEVSNG